MKDIDEAIKHCEEVEETQRGDFKTCPLSSSECDGLTHCKVLKHGLNKGCLKCASEHRQLAEWLRKLKAYREAYERIKKLPIRYNEVQGITRCLNIIEDCLGEDEADEASDNDR